jgi:hypothetical protein
VIALVFNWQRLLTGDCCTTSTVEVAGITVNE